MGRTHAADLDELDRRIIELLTGDGRLTNVQVARQLCISEATARRRIERLLHDHVIDVVAVPDPQRVAHEVQVLVAIQAEPYQAGPLAARLAALEQTRYVAVVSGTFDVLTEIVVPSHADLLEVLRKHVSGQPEVKAVQTMMILQLAKIGHRIVDAAPQTAK